MHALLNGEPAADTSFLDRACQFGDGLFETLAVRHGQPCLWPLHERRLQHGCERLGLPPVDPERLLGEARAVCQGREKGVLKIIVSAGPSARGYRRPNELAPTRWVDCGDWPSDEPWSGEGALRVQECATRLGTQPLLAGIKHLNRLEQVLARRELGEGIHEGVMFDQAGRPVEGIMSNLLLLNSDGFITPSLDNAGVAGTVRQLVTENAGRLGLPLTIAPVERDMLYEAEALFMTNALMGIRPVAELEGQDYKLNVRPPVLEQLHNMCFTFSGEIECNA